MTKFRLMSSVSIYGAVFKLRMWMVYFFFILPREELDDEELRLEERLTVEREGLLLRDEELLEEE